MTIINNLNKTQFHNQTKEALETLLGSNVRDSTVRTFIKNQFRLQNEHLIPSLFENASSTLTAEQFKSAANEVLIKSPFLEIEDILGDSRLEAIFGASLIGEHNIRIFIFITITFNPDALGDDNQLPIYFKAGADVGGKSSYSDGFTFNDILNNSIKWPKQATQTEIEICMEELKLTSKAIQENATLSRFIDS
ncbi:hypothetical protein L1267_12160 [Pseudoalteromonas sp. OFAV1]|uniref:hypothetical protein n=1 Tax=Pseudoalteromonas sp. OFAV1 TaxID=2908892 RepID=UPI001F199380|nr:hypothetical protein [Pseudoalteromonas sp. OFAV1]MCF2901145.1 hypothetical protein [Pseudoalteromonas sp. OFAV1]